VTSAKSAMTDVSDLNRLEFHYTPKHAWLKMVEVEIGVLHGQCINRRIGERKKLVSQIDAWQKQRNSAKAHDACATLPRFLGDFQ